MSSRQLEERQEREQQEWLATRLDLSTDQLEELDWTIDENAGDDGTVYGYTITFAPSDDAITQEMIDRITDRQGFVRIGPS